MEGQTGELYHRQMLDMLQAIWGEGFLSPGGPDEVARFIERRLAHPDLQ